MAKIKITVVKKISNKELYGENPPLNLTDVPVCPRLELGQEFVFDPSQFPEGMCPWAYADIQRDITHLRRGGSFPWIKEKNATLSCCSDGSRPVIFKIELLEP